MIWKASKKWALTLLVLSIVLGLLLILISYKPVQDVELQAVKQRVLEAEDRLKLIDAKIARQSKEQEARLRCLSYIADAARLDQLGKTKAATDKILVYEKSSLQHKGSEEIHFYRSTANHKDYFAVLVCTGNICRWDKKMPLRVFIDDFDSFNNLTIEAFHDAFKQWTDASNGRITFQLVNKPEESDISVRPFSSIDPDLVNAGHTLPNPKDSTDLIPTIEKCFIFLQKPMPLPNAAEGEELLKIRSERERMFRTAVLHELGHALGLGHSPNAADLLFAYGDVGSDFEMTISDRDRNTLRRLYAKDALDDAAKILKNKARSGDKYAQGSLGQIYLRGISFSRNEEKAKMWLKKASDQGNEEAKVYLANLLWKSGKQQMAFQLFTKAAQSGQSPKAYAHLGWMYSNGVGTEKSLPKAFECFKRSAEIGGRPEAYYHLAKLYEAGTGIEKNLDLALKYYQRAEYLGVKEAHEDIARLEK